MHVNNDKTFTHVPTKHTFENLKCVTTEGSRHYVCPDGNKYFSVTTVTGHKKKVFFAEWRRKNPEESKRVCSRGNNLHSLIEDYINNKELNPKGNETMLFRQSLPMLKKCHFIVDYLNLLVAWTALPNLMVFYQSSILRVQPEKSVEVILAITFSKQPHMQLCGKR